MTVTVIAILAGIVLVAMGGARESARVRKTRSTVATLHDLLMERYESYRYRRVPVSTVGLNSASRSYLLESAARRLLATRELMQIELPERWSDVVLASVPDSNARSVSQGTTLYLPNRTGLAEAYLRRYRNLSTDDGNMIRSNQGAECLYMIITMATADGEARSFFSDSEIGDVDNDGAPEFLDAWGNPISFIRWPAGFSSESELQDINASKDHDPFDPFRCDDPESWTVVFPVSKHPSFAPAPAAYRLIPLIYSAGPDGKKDIVATGNGWMPTLDPYEDVEHNTVVVGQRGSPYDDEGDGEEWHDNIHNHLIGVR